MGPGFRRDDTVEMAASQEDHCMTLSPTGFLRIGTSDLEYRFIGPAPDAAPTIVMLHEGLGSVGLWGDFPEKLQAATGCGVFAYSRAGYGNSRSEEHTSELQS